MGFDGIKREIWGHLERPDVTLYGLIDLFVCRFVFLADFIMVGVRMFAVFAFMLEDCVLLASVCHPSCKDVFFKYSICIFTPSSLPFLLSVLWFGREHYLPKPSFMLRSRWNHVPPTAETLHQLPALKAPYLLPTLQEPEASDTSKFWELHMILYVRVEMLGRLCPALLDPPVRWTVPSVGSNSVLAAKKSSLLHPLPCFYSPTSFASWQTGG